MLCLEVSFKIKVHYKFDEMPDINSDRGGLPVPPGSAAGAPLLHQVFFQYLNLEIIYRP